jgi:hypothetical protein
MEKRDNVTLAWSRYKACADYKNANNYYSTIDENYRYYQGDQWGSTESNGLPLPVFNVIKPVIRYKLSVIQQNDTSILYTTENTQDESFVELQQIAKVLTDYSKVLWEKNKMDYKNDCMLCDAAISGNGFIYHYFDDAKQEISSELIDGVNIYPSNPNVADIQSQEYIIIAFRRSLASVKREAEAARKNKLNNLSKDQIDEIMPDNDTTYQAGDNAKTEKRDSEMVTLLLMLWKDEKTNTIHFTKSTRDYEIVKDTDLGLELYPIAMMTWEPAKNFFFGVPDVKGLIPNQDYINTIASLMMSSTTHSAFPKMVYNADVIDNPSTDVGIAIGISGGYNVRDAIGYISPQSIGGDAFNMFERTISLTKELMGANDGALGNINPENASGKAILAVMEQTAVPLDGIKRRFYNYIEDNALIWADMWRVYHSGKAKQVTVQGDLSEEPETYSISPEAWQKLMLNVKVEVGPSSRWNELVMTQILDNLLQQQMIDLEFYVNAMPSSSGFPKAQMVQYLQQMQQRQQEAAQRQAMVEQQMQGVPTEQAGQPTEQQVVDEMLAQSTPDVNAMVDNMSEEERQMAMQNPKYMEQIIAQKMGLA